MATATDESMDTADDVLSEELVALQAIYIKELSVEYDEENRPQRIAVILHPATAMDESKQYVCMTLCFTFPPNYPDAVPEIMVKNPRGLGEENLQSLIEDMLKKAEERQGGQMLYELIEMAKDCLTDGNLPHCECAICLDHFEEGDNFIKTDCYHYYHTACLARCAAAFTASRQEEGETEVLHIKSKEENVFRCPMCRVPLSCDLDDLLTETPSEEKEVTVQLSPELIRQQQERAALYDQQKAKGGIIDLEHEKNKYLVDENTMVPLFSRMDGDSGVTSGEKPPELNGQLREWEPPAPHRKEERPYNKAEGGKPRTSQRTANQNYAGNRSRKSHRDNYADISQGYSDYEEDRDDRSHRGGGRGGRRTDHRSDRGRGSARKQREPQPTVDQTSRNNPTWKRDSDFTNSGQECSDFVPSGADSVRGGRNDRTRGRGANRDYRGHRRGGGGGRDHNRTYHRDDREDFRDSRDSQNYRRDHRDSKHDARDSTEHLRDREQNERRARKTDLEGRQESSGVREERDGDGGGADGFKNSRDFGKDAKEERPCDSDTGDGSSSRTDSWHDRTSPRDRRDQRLPRNEHTRGGQYRENARNRRGQNSASQGHRGDPHRPEDSRDRPRQNREREYRDTRPRGYHRETGDRESDRNSPREPAHSEKTQGSTGSPRENEGYPKQEDYRNHRRDFPDDRYRNQRSDDSRQYSYPRRNENYHGSRRDDRHQVNDKDTHDRRNQKHEDGIQQFGKTYDGENQRRCLANTQNSHEADDGETLQEDAEHGWNKRSGKHRGDRTFVRGQGKRGGRTQNRPPSTQSDTGNPSQTTTGRGRRCLEEQLIELVSPVEQGSKKTGQSAKDGTRSDIRCRTSNEDLESEVCKSHSNKPHPGRGQRFSKQEKEHGIGEQSEKRVQGLRDGESGHGHRPPSGVSCPRAPPGFAQQGKSELSQSADPPRPALKVAPPPGFS